MLVLTVQAEGNTTAGPPCTFKLRPWLLPLPSAAAAAAQHHSTSPPPHSLAVGKGGGKREEGRRINGENKEGKYSCANGSWLQRSDHLLVNPNSEEGWSRPFQAPYVATILK